MKRTLVRSGRAAACLAALLLLAAAGTRAHAQSSTISGTVVDAQTNLALPGAVVRAAGVGRSAVTGQNGRFVLTGVPAGTHDVEVSYMGYQGQAQRVAVAAGSAGRVSFLLQPGAVEVDGVTVVGQRTGQARALNQQLTSANITNVVAADQIGRFPDANIGDAIKRIPGINVALDQGEARFGLIRGTEPRLNSVMLNGERVPSAEAEVREVQLDLIPSDMVAAVEVNKALTPDMDADAIGGAVNIVTRAAPPGRRISTTLGSGYNYLSGQPMGLASGVLSERFAGGRMGLVLSGSYFNHELGSDNIEAVWERADDGQAFVEEFDVRRYDVQRVRRSVAGSLDFQLSPVSTLTWRSMYNHRDDWENRYRLRYALDEPGADGVQEGVIRRQTKGGIDNPRVRNTRLEDQRVQSHALSGDHLLGRVQAQWSAAYARASEFRPDERYIEYEVSDVPIRADLSNPRKPAFAALDAAAVGADRFDLRRIEDFQSLTREEDLSGRLDVMLPLAADAERSNLKVGARLRMKDKLRDNSYARVSPLQSLGTLSAVENADLSDPGYLAGNYPVGTFATREFLGRMDFRDGARFRFQDRPQDYMPGNYDANERITAGYAMLSQRLTDRLSVIAGLRVENTDIRYDGHELNEDDNLITATTGADNYTNLLPGIHARFELAPRTVLRAAWTNTLARPNYYDLVPYRVVSFDDDVLAVGNPDLDPTTAMNFDVMLERYFQSVGLVSAGVFYKDVNDFIFTYTRNDQADPATGRRFRRITQPQNGGNADLWGAEFAVQRQLDFLPGFWSGFGIYANYTFTDSRVRGLNVEGREDERLALPGTSRHTGNASLSYDARRLSLRGSLNFQDSFIDPGSLGDDAFYDRYYDRAVNVDVNASLTVTPQLRVFLEANNLTNQPLRYYQGVRERMMQEEFYDRRFTAGLKYDL